MREKFSCGVGQINFDGKLMKGLEGYGKVNRLAVVLVQETENKLLCIAKMEQSTGSVEAEKIKEVLVEWEWQRISSLAALILHPQTQESTRRSILVCPARLWQSSTDTPGILQKI